MKKSARIKLNKKFNFIRKNIKGMTGRENSVGRVREDR